MRESTWACHSPCHFCGFFKASLTQSPVCSVGYPGNTKSSGIRILSKNEPSGIFRNKLRLTMMENGVEVKRKVVGRVVVLMYLATDQRVSEHVVR